MTREEAYQVLGLQPGASEAEASAPAHHRLMAQRAPGQRRLRLACHQENLARDVLLGSTGAHPTRRHVTDCAAT